MAFPALSLKELRALPEDELVRRHDVDAKTTGVGIDYYLGELNRRYQERQTKAMVVYTKHITRMTVVITVATIVTTVAAVANLLL